MTLEPREWLPASVLAGDLVRVRLTRALSEWSERWFAQPDLQGVALSPIATDEVIDVAANWTIRGDCIAVQLSKDARNRLEELALGVDLRGVNLTEVDGRVLASFGQAMIADLAETVQRHFRHEPGAPTFGPGSFDKTGAMLARISVGRTPLLSLALAAPLLTACCKLDLGSARPGRLDPESLLGALGRSLATVEATLGDVQLSLADLKTLGVGDVIILDGAVSRGGTLGAPGDGPAFARFLLGQSDGRLSLILQPLLN